MEVKELKEKFIDLIAEQLSGDISTVDTNELGMVVDMAKDCAELMKYCAETEYYTKITDAMGENSSEENAEYIAKYLPETTVKYYTPHETWRDRMYYTTPHDEREGHSYLTRKTYMEMIDNGADKSVRSKELEQYVNDLADDINEMLASMDSADKQILKQKISVLASKI